MCMRSRFGLTDSFSVGILCSYLGLTLTKYSALFVNHISTVDFPNPSLTSFTFVSEPWRPPVTPPPESDASQPLPRQTPTDKGRVSLVINFTDFHDCKCGYKFDYARSHCLRQDLKPPTSTLVLYHLTPVVKPIPTSSNAKVTIWVCHFSFNTQFG